MLHVDIPGKFCSSPSNIGRSQELQECVPASCASEIKLKRTVDNYIIKSNTCSTLLLMNWASLMRQFNKKRVGFDINLLRIIGNRNLIFSSLTVMPILKDFPCCDLKLLGSICDVLFFKSGVTICKEGDNGDNAYIILSGKVFSAPSSYNEQSMNADNDERMIAQTKGQYLTEGQYFGEISPFLNIPRRVSITTTTDVLLASISKNHLRSLSHEFDDYFLRRFMLEELLRNNSPFLDQLDESAIAMIANLMTIEIVEEGHSLCTEEDQVDKFYFVFYGHCSMKTNQDNAVRNIHAGQYFGELVLFDEVSLKGRSVVALTKSAVLVLSRESFAKFIQKFPQLRAGLTIKSKGSRSQFQDIISYERARDAFCSFLNREQKINILICYDTITEIKSVLDHTDKVTEMITNFAETFLTPKAPKFLEVPKHQLMILELDLHLLAKSVRKQSDPKQVEDGILDPIQKHIRQILETELLPRFKISEEWLTLCRDFNFHNDTNCLDESDLLKS
jgi:cAMP-binding proteins - catabolite gene activator and regulatory subunit of cAMP-dependent protein kinases